MTQPLDDPVLASLLARVPAIAGATAVFVSVLPGGLSNTNYLVDADGERFVARHGCDNALTLGIDRKREEGAARYAHDAGFAPEVLVFIQPEGHSVVRYVPDAASPTIDQFVSAEMVERVARRMRDVHALPGIEGTFDPFDVIQQWKAVLDSRGSGLPTRLDSLLSLVDVADSERLPVAQMDLVLCHNDPYHLNFLDDGSLWLIDWEYAGMGNAMYDLAGIALNLDGDGRDHLLQSYFGDVTPRLRDELDLLVPVVVCWNTMWCLIQVEESVLDFDYFSMAEEYLDLFSRQPE